MVSHIYKELFSKKVIQVRLIMTSDGRIDHKKYLTFL